MLRNRAMALVFIALLCSPVVADDWVTLGSRVVQYRAEQDTIQVSKKGTFRKIKLQVRGNGVRFYDLKVHFENGGIQDVPLKTHIGKGGETRVIDLDGGERHLEKVVFRYETQGRGNRRATVILKGRR